MGKRGNQSVITMQMIEQSSESACQVKVRFSTHCVICGKKEQIWNILELFRNPNIDLP